MNMNYIGKLLILFSICISIIGCTKYFNPEPVFEEYDQEENKVVKRKILIVSVDGLVGKELEKNVPTNIANLMRKGKYSYSALADQNTSDPSSWTTLMTGYTSNTHKILDNNYMPVVTGTDPHGKSEFKPTFIYRLENNSASIKSSVVVRDAALANMLLMDADNNILAKNDDEVTQRALTLLEDNTPDVLVLQFTSVLDAGRKGRFSADNQEYAAAIKKVDEHIGAVVSKIESREDAEFEDWLIIITSNHGGIGNTYGGESFQERNVFTLYYQKDLISQEINAEMMNALRFWGHNTLPYGIKAKNDEPGTSELYNLNDELTFEVKYNWAASKTVVWEKNNTPVGNNSFLYAPIVSKKYSKDQGAVGWGLYSWDVNIALSVSDGTKGVNIQTVRSDGAWDILTGRIKKLANGAAEISLFKSGVLVETTILESFNFEAANNNILSLGYTENVVHELPDFSLANLRIWKRALTDQEIKESICKSLLTAADLRDEKLLGEWNLLNADQDKIANSLSTGRNFFFEGGNPRFFTTQLYTPCGRDESEILMENKDIASHVFYWLGLKPNDSWKLEGKVFLSEFEVEFLKP